MTKQTCFNFITWKDKNTTKSYREYYTLNSEEGSNYTIDELWKWWRKNVLMWEDMQKQMDVDSKSLKNNPDE